jgi:ABC-type uncharacterized transport system permease subunit
MSEEMLAVFIGSSIRLAMPLALAATGELVSERAGVLNMSVEGMMLIGAFGGAIGAGPPAARCSAWPSACWPRCRWPCCRRG